LSPFILKTVKDKENLLTYTTESTYLDEYNEKKTQNIKSDGK